VELHSGCLLCKKNNTARADIVDEVSGRIIVKKGDFVIKCDGIPANPGDHLISITDPAMARAMGGEEALRQVARMQDVVLWAEDNIVVTDIITKIRKPWSPQGATQENAEKYNLSPDATYYQEIMAKCTARRLLLRIGRRSGKTWTLILKILHKLYTNEKYRILVITPNIAQLDVIFSTAREFISSSPTLNSPGIRFVRTPQRYLELPNGSFMRGFVSGNESIRGQAADMVVIDEADYLTTDDLSAITAILSEHKDTVLAVSSTPSGAREQFWKWDHAPNFRSFHFPSMARPLWDDDMMIEQRRENPGVKFVHEILAEYGEISEGVFQHSNIDEAVSDGDYQYKDQEPIPGWIYTMGVDWNPVNGTEIYVTGVDPGGLERYRSVDAGQVFREGHTQIQAVNEIIRLNRKWNPVSILVDRGAGSVQVELLQKFGEEAAPNTPDRRLMNIVQVIDFGSKIEMRHPSTGVVQKVYAKPAIVENAIRMFESNQIALSKWDAQLLRELRGFIIDKIGMNGRCTYAMISDDIEDHKLDAYLLSLFAFTMKFSQFGQPDIVPIVRFTGLPGGGTIGTVKPNLPNSRSIYSDKREGKRDLVEEDRDQGMLQPDEIRQGFNSPGSKSPLERINEQTQARRHTGRVFANPGRKRARRTPVTRSRIR
tara:strand:+ start:24 stop:1991 length:1968 start_codon:yes stop_codon:yes gene_type:complete